jgi:hypothetical protein
MYLPYCFQHSRSVLGLAVKPSLIADAGLGLFAARDFEAYSLVVEMNGELLTKKELESRYPGDVTAPYVIQTSDNSFYDGALQRYIGQYANSVFSIRKPYGSVKSMCNAEFIMNTIDNRPYIQTTKAVKAGTEILVWYCKDYRLDTSKSTTRRTSR